MEICINSYKTLTAEKQGNNLRIQERSVAFKTIKIARSTLKVFKGNKIYLVELIEWSENKLRLAIDGKHLTITINSYMDQVLRDLGMNSINRPGVKEIRAPMPGTMLKLMLKVGDQVAKGDQVLILEAMKMENVIKSPGEGVISKIHVSEGDNVEKNGLLISFK